jgi:hypothetical protein
MSQLAVDFTLPTMSPSVSEVADWDEVLTFSAEQVMERRVKALEDGMQLLRQ